MCMHVWGPALGVCNIRLPKHRRPQNLQSSHATLNVKVPKGRKYVQGIYPTHFLTLQPCLSFFTDIQSELGVLELCSSFCPPLIKHDTQKWHKQNLYHQENASMLLEVCKLNI